MPFAEETLANYLTATIRDVVRAEVLDPVKSKDKLYREPRIFEDLLSSQPLCFNVFGELQRDLGLASRVFEEVLKTPGLRATAIEFEHSPGRGDARFTDDHSAFDVFVSYTTAAAVTGFVGIEVKYVESLDGPPARHRGRYEEVADAMGIFLPDTRRLLRCPPLEQLWRDHLLVGSLALDPASGFQHATFAVLYPSGNTVAGAALRQYRSCLRDATGFLPLTLEQLLDSFTRAGAGDWARELRERYLGP